MGIKCKFNLIWQNKMPKLNLKLSKITSKFNSIEQLFLKIKLISKNPFGIFYIYLNIFRRNNGLCLEHDMHNWLPAGLLSTDL